MRLLAPPRVSLRMSVLMRALLQCMHVGLMATRIGLTGKTVRVRHQRSRVGQTRCVRIVRRTAAANSTQSPNMAVSHARRIRRRCRLERFVVNFT
jgi:hypothetical protein